MIPARARAWAAVLAVAPLACTKPGASAGEVGAASPPPGAAAQQPLVETLYKGGLKSGWKDAGWCPHSATGPGPAELHFTHLGGWVLAKPGLKLDAIGSLVFQLHPPAGEADFLEVRLESSASTTFPRVKVSPRHRTANAGGWVDVEVPIEELDPERAPFDRVVLRAYREIDDAVTLVDGLGFTRPPTDGGGPFEGARYATGAKPVAMTVACDARAARVSPLIYGIGYLPSSDDQAAQWALGATARRWGGNSSSRYNWENSSWNLDADWFFENKETKSYEAFLADDDKHGVASALSIPMLGWVAKDGTSFSFPVSVYGPQGHTDGYQPEAGDGTKPDGKKIEPGPPTRTSVPAPPEWAGRWVAAIRARDVKNGKRSVSEYILDNEPMLWTQTQRDVRTEPLGYDEFLDRTLKYGTAIRQADPDAVIAGPAEWGWTGYFFSNKDAASTFLRPDRRAHGDDPLALWYLKKLREHEQQTGVRVLDVFDLHFYPQAPNVYGGADGVDAKTAALRLRSTRALWDPGYVDESWIKEPVRLLPRMREWVDKGYPGRGLSIGEWNFGGEAHVSGAMAIAEALGRFAQFGVRSAFYWTHPADGAVAIQGFRAFRNFDGRGGHFLDWYVPSTTSPEASLFVSRDEAGGRMVAVVVNTSPDDPLLAEIDLGPCGGASSYVAYTFARGRADFAPWAAVPGGKAIHQVLLPWSITVIDAKMTKPMIGGIEK